MPVITVPFDNCHFDTLKPLQRAACTLKVANGGSLRRLLFESAGNLVVMCVSHYRPAPGEEDPRIRSYPIRASAHDLHDRDLQEPVAVEVGDEILLDVYHGSMSDSPSTDPIAVRICGVFDVPAVTG